MPNRGKQVCWRAHSHIPRHSHRQRWRRRYVAESDVSNGCNLQLQFYCLAAHAAPNESYRRSLVFLSNGTIDNSASWILSVLFIILKNEISLWVFFVATFENVLRVFLPLTIINRSLEQSVFTIDTWSDTSQSKFANESVSLSYPEFV